MNLVVTTALFLATAVAEIVGCYLPYLWLKGRAPLWVLVPAAASLALFAWLLTLHPAAAGRVYAAYGGVYVATAVLWLWLIDGVRPTTWDIAGSLVAVSGMAIIMLAPRAWSRNRRPTTRSTATLRKRGFARLLVRVIADVMPQWLSSSSAHKRQFLKCATSDDPKEKTMTEADRIKYLRIALVVVGLTFTFGLWPLTIVWPSGWSWHAEGRSYYLEMILAIYATLGVFLILAARNPLAHRSLIW
jgi:small multidrug resistance family-3 protein